MERHYWLHRITGGENALALSYPLLFNHRFLSIGWSDLSTREFVNKVSQDGFYAIEDEMKKAGFERPKHRFNLERFMVMMKKGDYVVVPTWGEFSIYEITDNSILCNEDIDTYLLYDWNGKPISLDKDGYLRNSENKWVDLGFYRRVKCIAEHISRAEYATQKLFSRMKIRQTNADIDDLEEDILKAIKSFETNSPINLKNQLIDKMVSSTLDTIRESLKDQQFEELVEWYLDSIGATMIKTPAKNESSTEEGDADKVALFEKLNTIIMVQVKKHEGETSKWAVEQIRAFNRNHNYDNYITQMWVISTCDNYSDEAKRAAQESNVRLINGYEFAKMIIENGIGNLPL